VAVPVDMRARAGPVVDDHEGPVARRHRFECGEIVDGRLNLPDRRTKSRMTPPLKRRRDRRDLFDGDPGAGSATAIARAARLITAPSGS
jgi:hypothetical protein